MPPPMARRTISGSRILITGASSGIGQALALELARQGARLVLNARRLERLQTLADTLTAGGREVHLVSGDITQSDVRLRAMQAAQEHLGGLDILINCAGVGAVGPFAVADEARLRQVMEVNFFAPVEMIRLGLPILRGGHSPLVVNIGSVLGHCAVPAKSEYCASKFALRGFADALRAELANDRIDVLTVSPSTTETEFFDQLIAQPPGFKPRRGMSAQRVARAVVRAIATGRREIVLSWGGKLLVWLQRFTPGLVRSAVIRHERRQADSHASMIHH